MGLKSLRCVVILLLVVLAVSTQVYSAAAESLSANTPAITSSISSAGISASSSTHYSELATKSSRGSFMARSTTPSSSSSNSSVRSTGHSGQIHSSERSSPGASVPTNSLTLDNSPIRLVLQITIDQLRGDLPNRFAKRFGTGGFRYLQERGSVYTDAHYCHADTETAPGHATLATGGTPLQHGILASEWWDYKKNKILYAVEDADYPVLGERVVSTAGTSTTEKGRAPTNLLSSTIGDEIHNATEGGAKVFAVSGKDRAAILTGGRTGKAYWLSAGKFTTSTYYERQLPDWVHEWNERKIADSYRGKKWQLLQDPSTYSRISSDDRPFEGSYLHLGRTIPKELGCESDVDFYNALLRTPVNDSLVLDFAKHLIDTQQLGVDDVVDYLSVSFSSTDYVGHVWGIGSLEAEDNILRVDRNLADLFNYVDSKVGLNRTLIVLCADHGVSEIAEQIRKSGQPAGRISSVYFRNHVSESLKRRFKTTSELVRRFVYPYLYLDEVEISKSGLDLSEVEVAAARAAREVDGIAYAATRTSIEKGFLPSDRGYFGQIRTNFHPERAGHVHVVTDQFYMFGYEEPVTEPGEHGSVWSYDTYVPLMLVGPGIARGRYARRVGPHDLASTIANRLGIKPPSGSIGHPLVEALDPKICRE